MEQGMKCFLTVLSNLDVITYLWLLSAWNGIIMTEKQKFEILTNLNILILSNSVATVWTVQLWSVSIWI